MKLVLILLVLLVVQPCFSQWEACNNEIWGGNISALASSGVYVCAGTIDGNIYISSDKGENWHKKVQQLSTWAISSISISNATIVATHNSKVMISTDYGESWTYKTEGLGNLRLLASALKGDSIIISAAGSLRLSVDKGNSWNILSCPIAVSTIKIYGDNIYVSTNNLFYVSTNGGKEWISRNKGLGNVYHINSISTLGNNVVIGTDWGIFYSSDTAKTWVQRNKGLMDVNIRFGIANDTKVFAVTQYDGLYVSMDSCKKWSKPLVQSAINPKINCLAISEDNLYAGTSDAGVLLSTDNGINWEIKSKGIANARVTSIAAKGDSVYAYIKGIGVYKSIDNGINWNLILPLHNSARGCISISGSKIWVSSDSARVYLSIDNGTSWAIKGKGLSSHYSICGLIADGDHIWLGNDSVKLSTDNGETWLNKGGLKNPTSIAANGRFIMAGRAGDCVFLSSNSGESWTNDFFPDTGYGFEACFINGKYFYICKYSFVSYFSSDNGNTWNSFFIYNDIAMMKIIEFAFYGKNIFAGTNGYGVYTSSDNSQHWESKNNGLDCLVINSLTIGNKFIYAATDCGGIFRCKLTDIVSVNEENSVQDNPSELIGYYNLLGERVTDINQFHGLLIKVQRIGTKVIAEKIVKD